MFDKTLTEEINFHEIYVLQNVMIKISIYMQSKVERKKYEDIRLMKFVVWIKVIFQKFSF